MIFFHLVFITFYYILHSTVAFSLSRTPLRDLCRRRDHTDLTTLHYITRATASIVQNRCPWMARHRRTWLSARLRYQAASTPFVWLWILRYPT